MTTSSAFRLWPKVILPILFGAATLVPVAFTANGQAPQAATQSLLEKAHALEVRGRMDMASQTWQQVLLADPNNTEALGGMARAAKLSGKPADAQRYIEKLRSINPNDPGIARAENMGTESDHQVQLREAGKLAQQGQYGQAMALYRKVYGDTPPSGDQALAFYETEAATEDGRPHAIAGLRMLAEKNPADSRYQIALGRILTYNPKTRAEGRKLLAAYPADPGATEALRQSLLWEAQNPATGDDIRAYLAKHPDAQLATALRAQPAAPAASARRGPAPVPQTPEQRAAAAQTAGRNAESQAAYKALNAKHLEDAETRFKAILAKTPDDSSALAGMGYVRMQQGNFGGAISYLAQARQNGGNDKGIDAALETSRFYNTMGEGAIALNENDLPLAEKQYRAAFGMRPTSPEALEGLGGTLLRAEQPEAAMPYFQQFVKVKPSAAHAWRGLFLSEYGAGNSPLALQTERQIPSAPRAELAKDPLFLRALASAYSSVGRDADAQRVLKMALDLPFPAGARGLEADTQLQYAGLLQQANRFDQAAGLYRQVLVKDQNNTPAWQGLVRAEHATGNDAEATQTLESMPPAVFAQAMKEPGFESTVASVYQAQRRLDVAQDILEKSIAQQTTAGQKPFIPSEVQLAGLYLERGNPTQAYPLYQQLLSENPDRPDAWKGVLTALHTTGRDQEALAEIQQIPPSTRARLEQDPAYLQVVGSIYNALGNPQQAELFLRRVQQHYAQEHTAPPADIDVQNAWLLYNGRNEAGLYRQLLALGSRPDLTDEQRRTVQTIWANWAVRRANQSAALGDTRRAVAILNATAQSFGDNPAVIKILAGGYASAGMSKQAVAIWKAQDLKTAPVADYRSAVGAALANNDQKDAEIWLRFGLDQYPRDPDLLSLAAKYEQARGDNNRAVDYYQHAIAATPKPDPGAELATMLSAPAPTPQLPSAQRQQDLATLLAPNPNDPSNQPMQQMPPQPVSTRPYLPGANSGYGAAPIQLSQPAMPGQMGNEPMVPVYPSTPAPAPQPNLPSSRLRDYVPQSSVYLPLTLQPTGPAPRTLAVQREGSTLVLIPAAYRQQAAQQGTAQQAIDTGFGPAPQQKAQPLIEQPTSASQKPTQAAPADEVYGPYVPYKAPAPITIQPVLPPAQPQAMKPEAVDAQPRARYVPNARIHSTASSHPDVAAANAAAIRRAPSYPAPLNPAPLNGTSKPPTDDYSTVQIDAVQYSPAQGQAAAAAQNSQVGQPQQGQPPTSNNQQTVPQQSGDSYGQQYPQPHTATATPAHNRHVTRKPAPPTPVAASSELQQPAQPGMSYPGVAQPLTYQPYPAIGPAYPLGAPPTDYDLMQKRVPPLRGGYETAVVPQVPLTQRQQAELDLESLEASYSGWLGGTGSARYRSGTSGLDRLTDLEATVEASIVANNNVRFTIVPRAVFLNSGSLDSTQYTGLATNAVPFLGTLPASAIVGPAQQNASGVGGEIQASGRNFAVALGYTPFEFLVRNVIGRALYKPTQHFTLYASRDNVTETQLSYAGLRDPGAPGGVVSGNIWGGVVSTGGGLRFDYGDERAGFYVTADGADITGYHVLENNKFEGSAGAYFLAHSFPGYGRLNIGASMFGMHYAHNERGQTYGLGGYFSPDSYFLASIPVTFIGHYKSDFHYSIAGSIGVQTFQEDSQVFFPLDRGIQTGFNFSYPTNSNTGGNYSINAEGAYRLYDHWYAGGFLSANNTNNYNTVTGGFFVRYLFRKQLGTEEYPTGLFPVEGFRPLRVP